ncbi:MAG: hypothetical protein Q8R28_15335 [Dehalococcoidia bacterium]|nr:hypothetical protein [Dehalococcoidia bacterium]
MTKILFRCDCCGYSITTMPASFRWEKSEQYWLCPNCTSHITRVTGVLELDRSSHGYKDLYDETKKAWQAGVSDGQERVKRPLLVMPRPVRTVMASGLMFGASGLMFSGEPSGNGFFQVTESPEEQKLEANKFVPPPGKTELGRKLRMEGK